MENEEAKGKELRILAIDDSPLILKRLVAMLNELPEPVTIHTSRMYAEAEALLQKHVYDVIIIDINLPDKSGIELLRHIKAAKYPVKNIIIITGDPSPEKEELCLALGAGYFLSKFIDFEKIPGIIRSI